MATIKISELNPAGSSLFADSDSYLNELTTETEIDAVKGGSSPVCVSIGVSLGVVLWMNRPRSRR
jgi:hypothetical protein